jgi:hypothetical protein
VAVGTYAASAAAAFAAAVILGGCADGGDSSDPEIASTEAVSSEPTETAEVAGTMRLTLTDDGCTYVGDDSVESGTFTAEVENQTEFFGAFALAGLVEGSVIDDLEPWLEEARQQFQDSGTLPDLPPFYEQVTRTGVEAGASGFLPVDVPAGSYALMCFVDDLPTWRVYPAAQLEVTG